MAAQTPIWDQEDAWQQLQTVMNSQTEAGVKSNIISYIEDFSQLVFTCLLTFICLFLVACQPEPNDDEYRDVIINNVGFRIPIEYYHPLSIPKNNTVDVNTLLRVVLPNISKLEKNWQEYELEDNLKTMRATRLMISSPFNDVAGKLPRVPFKNRVKMYLEDYEVTEKVEDKFELTYYKYPSHKKIDWDEVLYEGEKDNPNTILRCAPIDRGVSIPHCKMQFKFKDNIIRVSFRRTEWLPQWAEIKNSTLTQLEKFHQDYLDNKREE